MKYALFCLLALSVSTLAHGQEYHHFHSSDNVDVARYFGKDFLRLMFTNRRNEKVYVGFDMLIWKEGDTTIGTCNGGGLTLAPGESSNFGMFFTYPAKIESIPHVRFELHGYKVEIGGQGKDPRYQNDSSGGRKEEGHVTALDFNNNTYKTEGSDEWKPMPKAKSIDFPGDGK